MQTTFNQQIMSQNNKSFYQQNFKVEEVIILKF